MLSLVKPRKIAALAYPPVFTSVGGDLCQFVAVQEIPNFGLHGYYAISIEPLPKWSHASTNSAKKAKLKPKHFADCFKDTCKLAEEAYHSKNKPDKPASSSLSSSQQPASQQQLLESADKNSQELVDPKNAEAGSGNKKKQPNDCERISRPTPKFVPFPPIPYQSYRKEIAGFESRPTWGRSRYFERLIDESPHLPTDLDVSQADALLHGISDKTFKKAENHGPCAISETRRRVERMMDLPPCALDPGEAMPPPGSPYTCCPKREPVIDTHCVDMCLSEQDFYPCEERSSVSLRGGSDSGSCCNSQNRRSRSRTSSNSRINDINSRQYYAAQFPRQQRNEHTTRYGSINDDTDGTLDVDTSIQNITTTSRYLDPEKSGNFKWLEDMEHVTFSDPTEMSFTGSDSRARMRSFSSNTTMNGGSPDFDEEPPINEELHPEELMPRAAERMHSSKLHHSQRSSSPPGRSSSCYPNNRSYTHDSWEQQTGLSHINEDIEPSIAVVRRRYAKSREASNRRPEIHEKTYRWKEIVDETEPSRNESLCSKDVNRMSSFDPEYLDYIEAVRSDHDYCCEDEDEEIEKPRYSNRISGPAMDRDMLQYSKKLMRPPKPPPSSGRVIMPLSKQSQRKQRILEMEETNSPDVNVNEDE
ncbi:uncharacterized protein LOC124304677 [Neodiprion virginianus]|uniref:uncharacterized protein LOC124304677 n=1 Tax=Neodiprion virginianus TaxID=2961670 RepID=UPI001EE75852|nr:uncharacterized protein LOC124304677 [Neodiprion virginianus]